MWGWEYDPQFRQSHGGTAPGTTGPRWNAQWGKGFPDTVAEIAAGVADIAAGIGIGIVAGAGAGAGAGDAATKVEATHWPWAAWTWGRQ